MTQTQMMITILCIPTMTGGLLSEMKKDQVASDEKQIVDQPGKKKSLRSKDKLYIYQSNGQTNHLYCWAFEPPA